MPDYDLYYWPVPFRGQFIRAILAFAGKTWTEHDSEEIGQAMEADPTGQAIPFMGPPLLVDRSNGFALSQMPAIALYLGERLALVPDTIEGRALTAKIVNDANDVIDEITLDGGREMWTGAKWREFVPRLRRWMAFFEEIGARHALTPDEGYLLGTPAPGIADIVAATLWSTMGDRFMPIAKMLEETAPAIAGLVGRMIDVPALNRLKARAFDDYGDSYCGGEIETSLRQVAK